MAQIPTKQDCYYVIEMIDAGLIDTNQSQEWADQFIEQLDEPPMWLINLSLNRDALQNHVHSEPFESSPPDLEWFHLGCLWLRHERGELSWAKFLEIGGGVLDAADRIPECETHFHYLRIHQEASFSPKSEEQTRRDYFAEQDLKPWIELARKKFEPFRLLRKKRTR